MKKRNQKKSGFTLIEATLAMALTMIVALAAINLKYFGVDQVVRADAYSRGGRLAQLLLESWRVAPLTGFDPVSDLTAENPGLSIAYSSEGPGAVSGLTTLGQYLIQVGGINYEVTLAYMPASNAAPALLAVGVGWRPDYAAGTLEAGSTSFWLSSYR